MSAKNLARSKHQHVRSMRASRPPAALADRPQSVRLMTSRSVFLSSVDSTSSALLVFAEHDPCGRLRLHCLPSVLFFPAKGTARKFSANAAYNRFKSLPQVGDCSFSSAYHRAKRGLRPCLIAPIADAPLHSDSGLSTRRPCNPKDTYIDRIVPNH